MKGKILFDFSVAILLLPFLLPVIFLLVLISSIDTSSFGVFSQTRIGKNGQHFKIFKIKSMKGRNDSDVTTEKTHAITQFGKFLRKSKMDELPQIFNILKGDMSFVGPRPDVPGYADALTGDDRIILKVKPGITGPAQLAFKNEEEILNKQENPLLYNDQIIWPEKIRINKEYVENWSFSQDVYYILKTLY